MDIPKQLDWKQNGAISVFRMDNCAYYNGTSYTRDGITSSFVNTINTYQRFWNVTITNSMSVEDDTFAKDFIDNKYNFR